MILSTTSALVVVPNRDSINDVAVELKNMDNVNIN